MSNLEKRIRNILDKIPKVEEGKRVVLGIDGLSRSGKTTLVKEIKQHFHKPVCIFHIDDYIVERKKRYNTGYEEWYEYYSLQWDVGELAKSLFTQLKEAETLQLLTYEDDADSHTLQNVILPNTCLIIIEGVFLQRKEWRDFFDSIIYIDSSRENRFNRESDVTRNNIGKFERRYWKAEEHYMKTVSPIEKADFVMRN